MPIPEELKQNANWCGWKYEIVNGRKTKVPYNLQTLEKAKSNDISTFRDFSFAEDAFTLGGFVDGLGIGIFNDYSAIDIDHCITDDGFLSDAATDICTTMKSYVEKSPSKTGVRIIFKTNDFVYDKEKYYIKNPNNGIEIYTTGVSNRFVTITGDTLYGYPICENQEALQYILDKYMLRPTKNTPKQKFDTKTHIVDIAEDELLSRAMKNYNFSSLFNGNMSAYNNDHSSADLALCNMLAFWTGKDFDKIDRLFKQSQLYREKWDREDYKKMTIDKAIATCSETYNPYQAQSIWDKLDSLILQTGIWTVDANGVSKTVVKDKKTGETETYTVTSTPIVPVAYLENPETGDCKVELHYLYNNQLRSHICEKETICNKTKIIKLANKGINITSASANDLTKYFSDMETQNSHILQHHISTSHLGWNGKDFVPYNNNIKFDGEDDNATLFQSVTQLGELNDWVNFMKPLRQNLYFRLIMAASFASPLIQLCGCLPFWFHLWGTSGTGKTVALMSAMSVWGNPKVGKLTQTFDSTTNALMSTVGFLYNFPMGIDELQTIKNNYSSYDDIIMKLTEGKERSRMQYNKILPSRQWHCAFISTGEEPITADNAGGGVKNRVIEVEIDNKFFGRQGNTIVNFILNNYGTAGKAFIESIPSDISSMYQSILGDVLNSADTTDKQAMAATLILLADKLACDCLFPDEQPLTVADIEPFIKSDMETDIAVRAYDWVKSWMVQHGTKFNGDSYETWGKTSMDGESFYVIATVLKDEMNKKGFNFDAVKKKWADRGWIAKPSKTFTKNVKIYDKQAKCVEFINLDD
jgi:uncharacterized protein (DUF927 family)